MLSIIILQICFLKKKKKSYKQFVTKLKNAQKT